MDAATGIFWRDNEHFAEVFSRTAFRDHPIRPSDLEPYDSVEDAILRMRDGAHITLKQTRDVVKALKDETRLVILGAENMTWVDYTMAFRVLSLDFINIARQISIIQNRNLRKWKKSKRDYSNDEYMSRFYKKDRIKPVITLVIYYGLKPWDGPKSLADMMEDGAFKRYAADYPIYILDVRHMKKELLEEFSPGLKAFFGYLMYENTDHLRTFVEENRTVFEDFPEQAIDALIEITHSKYLEVYKRENRTTGGGVNIMDGNQIYAEQYAAREKKKTFVETAQLFGQTLNDTIAAFITKFQIKDEKEAENEVKKYWKE